MAVERHTMSILSRIIDCKKQHRPLLAILVDPNKPAAYQALLPYLQEVDFVFVGGSTGESIEPCIAALRQHTNSPLVLFPGNIAQFSPHADALLFLSLLNARDADMLITPHIKVAKQVLQSGIESIPMGYILLDGERRSSVEKVLGKQLIYLEAGSGAKKVVSADIIRAVREQLQVPLIVGGGICTPQMMLQGYEAGADVVVIGNHFEQYPDELPLFIHTLSEYEFTSPR